MEVDAHKIKTVDRYAFVGFCSNAGIYFTNNLGTKALKKLVG